MIEGEGHASDFLAAFGAQFSPAIRSTSGRLLYSFFTASPRSLTDFNHSVDMRPSDVVLRSSGADILRITGYAVQDPAAGGKSSAMIEWKVLKSTPELQLREFIHLVDANGRVWSTDPDVEGYPTSAWRPGDTVVSWFDLQPPSNTPLGGYWLEVGFYDGLTQQRLVGAQGSGVGSVVRFGPLRVAGESLGTQSPIAIFGSHELGLTAVRVTDGRADLTWSALSRPVRDYTIFVHGLDEDGRIVAQSDSPPQAGAYPTVLWQPGDVVHDVHPLAGSSTAVAALEIGMYTTPDLTRLATSDGTGKSLGDHVIVRLSR